MGIHTPKDDFESLQKIYDRLQEHKETYILWILTNSSSAIIGQETAIKKTELETLPFPDFTKEEEEYLGLTETEKILRYDVLNHYKHLGKSITKAAYDTLERKLSINNPKDRKILEEGFAKTFCDSLNEIYAKNNKTWQRGKIYQTQDKNSILSEGFIIYQFGFGLTTSESEQIEVDEAYIKKLIFDTESNRGAIWVRVSRIYQHTENGYDCVFLIKTS